MINFEAVGRLKFALIIFGVTLVVLLAVFTLVGYFKPKSAGLLIETDPASTVYIDGQQLGRTRFETTRSQGEITLKLIPDSFDKPLTPFEVKVELISGVKTIIRRNFGESEETSSGAIISFEKVGGDEVSISIISNPDGARVKIDDVARDFTPFKSSSISEGNHIVSLFADGFKDETIEVKTYKGYKLTAEFKLAESPEAKASPTSTPAPEKEKISVKILTTPTGFLRVRMEPSVLTQELGQVKSGQIFELVEEDKETGWYKIEYKANAEGWISNEYASKITESEVTPTPTSTPKSTTKP